MHVGLSMRPIASLRTVAVQRLPLRPELGDEVGGLGNRFSAVRQRWRDELLAQPVHEPQDLLLLRLLRPQPHLHERGRVHWLRQQRLAQVHLPAGDRNLLMGHELLYAVVATPLAGLLAIAQTSTG